VKLQDHIDAVARELPAADGRDLLGRCASVESEAHKRTFLQRACWDLLILGTAAQCDVANTAFGFMGGAR